jgi:hypothetical protein
VVRIRRRWEGFRPARSEPDPGDKIVKGLEEMACDRLEQGRSAWESCRCFSGILYACSAYAQYDCCLPTSRPCELYPCRSLAASAAMHPLFRRSGAPACSARFCDCCGCRGTGVLMHPHLSSTVGLFVFAVPCARCMWVTPVLLSAKTSLFSCSAAPPDHGLGRRAVAPAALASPCHASHLNCWGKAWVTTRNPRDPSTAPRRRRRSAIHHQPPIAPITPARPRPRPPLPLPLYSRRTPDESPVLYSKLYLRRAPFPTAALLARRLPV